MAETSQSGPENWPTITLRSLMYSLLPKDNLIGTYFTKTSERRNTKFAFLSII